MPDHDTNNKANKEPDLFGQFARVEWLLHRTHQHNHRIHGPMGDPHRGQGRVLALLKLKPVISQKDLGFLLDMRPQSVGELLLKLEKRGYITRTPSRDDRRTISVTLTEDGAKAAAEPPESCDVFGCLSAEERAALNDFLSRVIARMEETLGRESFDPRGFGPRSGADIEAMIGRARGMPGPRGETMSRGRAPSEGPDRHGHPGGDRADK